MLVRVLTKLFGPIRLNESIYTKETEATLFSQFQETMIVL